MKDELDKFLQNYKRANNSHDWNNLKSFIHPNATYWFTDGKYKGIDEIREAVTKTFEKTKEETYSIKDIEWPVVTDTAGVCIYTFHWEGLVDGKRVRGSGRGTNVFIKEGGDWKIIHGHLSK